MEQTILIKIQVQQPSITIMHRIKSKLAGRKVMHTMALMACAAAGMSCMHAGAGGVAAPRAMPGRGSAGAAWRTNYLI